MPLLTLLFSLALIQQNVEPEVFAPGVISTADDELNAAFTPDQRTVFFTKSSPQNRIGVIFVSHLRGISPSPNGRGGQGVRTWTSPEVAPFSGRYSDYDPFVTADGAHIYFISNRPKPDSTSTKPQRTFDIWVVDKTANGWSAARSVGAPVNTDGQEFYPTLTASGTLYFSSNRPGGKGAGDIYRSRFVDGHFTEPETLGDSINTAAHEGDPFIAPDESYIIFASYGRPDDLGRGSAAGDLYISENVGGVWTKARHLDAPISSPAWDYCPIVSPDGRYFYFSSYRGFADTLPLAPQSARSLAQQMHGIKNGLGNVYRVDIAALRRSGQTSLRTIIERRYQTLDSAISKNDVAGMLAITAPTFTSDNVGGVVYDYAAMEARTRRLASLVDSTIYAHNTIREFTSRPDTAEAMVCQEWSRIQRLGDQRAHRIDTSVLQRERWVRLGSEWRRDRVTDEHGMRWFVDSVRVDPLQPYTPGAPAFTPNPDPPTNCGRL